MFSRYYTNFEVKPSVVIRSPALRIPELVIFLSMFTGVVIYQLGYKLGMFSVSPVYAVPIVEVRPPQSNFWDCSVAEGTCVFAYKERVDYCGKGFESKYHYSCSRLATSELQPEGQVPGDNMALVLSQWRIHEGRCSKDDRPTACYGWKNIDGNRSLHRVVAKDAESNLILLRTTIASGEEGGWRTTNSQLQSLLKFRKTGEIKRLPFMLQNGHVDTGSPHRDFFMTSFPHTCGSISGRGDTCMNTPDADFISLRVLLEAADFNLTAEKRLDGFVLQLNAYVTNADPADFWTWPFGFKPKIVYEPVVEKYNAGHDYLQFEDDINRIPHNKRRIHIFNRAALIKVNIHGEYAEFKISWFFSQLAIASTILGIAHMLVRSGLGLVYSWFRPTKHISLLLEAASKKATPHTEDLCGIDDEGEMFERLEGGRTGLYRPASLSSDKHRAEVLELAQVSPVSRSASVTTDYHRPKSVEVVEVATDDESQGSRSDGQVLPSLMQSLSQGWRKVERPAKMERDCTCVW
eukprot:TRINITY_DN10795_c0_g2_i1.p1 TRINITY_DN10795_c0_g2~~TRINITY_DN10795_c0_g2_i1.p1  ORF type:complete len:520 (+),score=54.52 TRINITY_DN10795_c0_g2_i1:68-1627(+)